MTRNEKAWYLDCSTGKPVAKPKWWQVVLVLLGYLSLAVVCSVIVTAVFVMVHP